MTGPSTPVDVDVVVVTYQSGDRVLRCLEHLQAAGATSVVVVDNASTDGARDRVRERFPSVDVVVLDENVGFGRAVNAGAARGHASAVVLVNDDAYVEPGFLRALVRPLQEDPRCGMVAGLLTVPGRPTIDGFGVQVDRRLAAWSRGRGLPLDADLGALSVPSGGAAAYRRTAFDAVGGFDHALFAYWEDVDLGLRLSAAGWTCAGAPDARGVHEGGASFGVGSPLQRRLAAFGRGFVLRRHMPTAPRDLLGAAVFEILHVAALVAISRSTEPLVQRVRGWRAARGRIAPPTAEVLVDLPLSEAVRRLAAVARGG